MGPQTTCPGRTLYNWLTASGGWMLKNSLVRICGIEADYQGLNIQPLLPSNWDQIKVFKVFRGANFDIEISRKNPGLVTVNGVESQLPITDFEPGETYKVSVGIKSCKNE